MVICWLTFPGQSLTNLRQKTHLMKRKSVAASTYKSRKSQWKCYKLFCCRFGFMYKVLSVEVICLYIVFLSQFMSFSSVLTYVHGMPFMCHLLGLHAPDLMNPQIRLALNGVKRSCSRVPCVKDPIDLKLLKLIFKSVKVQSNKWVTFWSACLLMFRCLLRISNIINSPHTLRVCDSKFTSWGCLVSIPSAKCSKPGIVHVLSLASLEVHNLCAVYWLKKLIRCCNLSGNDYLFCLHPAGLNYHTFREMLAYSLQSVQNLRISSHSFRIGGATLLHNMALPLAMIKERGGWRSWSVLQYLREPLNLRIARVLNFCKIFSGFSL